MGRLTISMVIFNSYVKLPESTSQVLRLNDLHPNCWCQKICACKLPPKRRRCRTPDVTEKESGMTSKAQLRCLLKVVVLRCISCRQAPPGMMRVSNVSNLAPWWCEGAWSFKCYPITSCPWQGVYASVASIIFTDVTSRAQLQPLIFTFHVPASLDSIPASRASAAGPTPTAYSLVARGRVLASLPGGAGGAGGGAFRSQV